MALLCLFPHQAMAAGATAAEFLNFGEGRAAAMSAASGSIAQDASALYWNPAGLAALESADVYVSHNSLPLTLRNDFAGIAVPLQSPEIKGVLGYSVQALTQSAIPKIDDTGATVGDYSAVDMAHTVGFATRWEDWRFGASARYIRESIDGDSGSSVAGNAGIQKDFGPLWTAGLSVSNIGRDLNLHSEPFPLPRTERAGAGLKLLDGELLFAGDISDILGIGVRGHVGAEYLLYPPRGSSSELFKNGGIRTRAGYTIGNDKNDAFSGAAWGVSLDIRSFRADFSYQPFGELGNSLQFGLGYRFGQ